MNPLKEVREFRAEVESKPYLARSIVIGAALTLSIGVGAIFITSFALTIGDAWDRGWWAVLAMGTAMLIPLHEYRWASRIYSTWGR